MCLGNAQKRPIDIDLNTTPTTSTMINYDKCAV